jgi:hypothetical protein
LSRAASAASAGTAIKAYKDLGYMIYYHSALAGAIVRPGNEELKQYGENEKDQYK